MSSSETSILNNNNARKTGKYYWLASPSNFTQNQTYGRVLYGDGYMRDDYVDSSRGVRPAVSLRPGTRYSDGDGSMANPYIIQLDEG